ncbi:MAG: glycosyltransferase [Burkholderiales bacterium]|nr:glycosyltransferase [Burkholderiales bacterium]
MSLPPDDSAPDTAPTASAQPAAPGAAAPGLTVLIRSVDRPSLAQAIGSVLAQTHPATRVLVLAAHGGPLTQLGELPPQAPVQVITSPVPLARAAAANVLLARAETELALFLDDDDWLLPEHLARLTEALARQPLAVAAHAGVQCVSGRREAPTAGHVFDHDLQWADMQWRNQLPIHAVAFRMAAVRAEPALHFDEALEHFEDWDFWLRLMARGDFVRVPGISALYWLDDQAGSGHAAAGSSQREQRLAQFGQRLLARWTPQDVARLIEHNAEQTRANHQHQQAADAALAQLQAHAEAVADALAQAQALGSRLDRQLHEALQREALLQAELAQRLAEREQLLAEGARLEAERAQLQQWLQAQRQESALLAGIRLEHLAQIELLNARIAALHASTSWRVTRPLRLAGRLLAWLRAGRLQRLLHNGWHACRTELRRKGLLGFVARWPQYLRRLRSHVRALSADAPPPAANPFAAATRPTRPVRLHPEIAGAAETIDACVSVVIPVLNGGEELVNLVRKLSGQQGVREVEIVIVDSGSTDGGPARLRALGARVIEIAPSEFSHSHARNLGADHARGDHLLFMVQDAYPIGNLWLHGLLRYLIDHREQGVVAASCAEYCRSDSDAMYDSMVHTHYRFLGCLEEDRIGHHTGDDHMSLRSMGQLSDVACLIPRALFQRYRYRGDYAEDLDLGIRLIRDGHRIAMLASVKVVHSHNRPAWYYLKRSFVDVIFLVGLFKDFHCPPCASVQGLVDGIGQVARAVSAWLPELAARPDGEAPSAELGRWIAAARTGPPADGGRLALGDEKVDAFVHALANSVAALPADGGRAAQGAAQREAQQFRDSFVARLDHFNQFASGVYGAGDARLRAEMADAVRKTFAATVGAALAYVYLDRQQPEANPAERQWIGALFDQLKAGV